jgi:hypothetical protein
MFLQAEKTPTQEYEFQKIFPPKFKHFFERKQEHRENSPFLMRKSTTREIV